MNREEFAAFVRSEQKPLRRFLLGLCCGNRQEADDIAQEALVKAYLSLNSYRDNNKFTAWLYRIAYNTFIDQQRKAHGTSPLEACRQHPESSYAADKGFDYQELYLALNALPPKERTAVLLFYLKGYSVKEISRIMDCHEDAVKKQLQRGREHLKKQMRQE